MSSDKFGFTVPVSFPHHELISLAHIIPPPSLWRDPYSSPWCFDVDLCICFFQLLVESSMTTVMAVTNLNIGQGHFRHPFHYRWESSLESSLWVPRSFHSNRCLFRPVRLHLSWYLFPCFPPHTLTTRSSHPSCSHTLSLLLHIPSHASCLPIKFHLFPLPGAVLLSLWKSSLIPTLFRTMNCEWLTFALWLSTYCVCPSGSALPHSE